MTMRNLVLSLGVGAAAAVAFIGSAHAQEAVEGKGVEVSPGTVLHPNVGAEFGVINNLFYEQDSVVTTALMRLTANFAVASEKIAPNEQVPDEDAGNEPAPQTFQFRAQGGLRYEEFFYYANPSTAAQRNLAFDLQAHLQAYPEGTWSFIGDDRLRRDVQPRNYEDSSSNSRDDNLLSLGLRYQPGGRTISGTLRYQNELEVFESTNVATRMNHTLGLRGDWQWLPYTRFFADTSLGFFGAVGSNGGDLPKASSMPIRGLVGIASTLTEPLTVKAHVGWAYSSYSAGEGYNGPLLDAEVGYAYAPTGRFTVEYNYDYEDSINGNYYRDHKFAAKLDQQLGEKFLLTGSFDVRLRGYRGIPMSLGAASRDDVVLAGIARAQYVLTERYYLTGQYVGTVVQTDYRYMAGPTIDDPSYTRHEVMLGARAAF